MHLNGGSGSGWLLLAACWGDTASLVTQIIRTCHDFYGGREARENPDQQTASRVFLTEAQYFC